MSLAALIGLILFVLTVERGWIGDLIAYLSLGLCFGIALAEGTRRALCKLIYFRGPGCILEFLPLFSFSFHLVALYHASDIQPYTIAIAIVCGFLVWTVAALSHYCESVVETMNDFTQHISSTGG
jgi:hypothetical protein